MLIRSPAVEVVRGQDLVFPVTMPAGVSVVGWAFKLTVRRDPDFPRPQPAGSRQAQDIDPSAWAEVLSSTTLVAAPAGYAFALSVPRASALLLPVGRGSCVLDVWRTDAGNTYPVVAARWLDVLPSVYG